MVKGYKAKKKGAGQFVQLHHRLLDSAAWRSLKPGPRALYVELKRRYTGRNNGKLILSHRDAAEALGVHRNTIGPWYEALIERGFVRVRQRAFLGPEGVAKAPLLELTEVSCEDRPATRDFERWKPEKPATKTVHRRQGFQDAKADPGPKPSKPVLQIVP